MLAWKKPTEAGFTLVELAIVLMIIGLLIGGILRGQELMNNARLNAVIKQVQSYTGAVPTFMDSYGAKPGDFPLALTRLKGCTAASNCRNGDGNGIVGAINLVWIGGQQGIATENTQFWKHLALTNIISGIVPTASQPVWGESHPASPISGGFTVITTRRDPADPTGSSFGGAFVLRLHGDLNNPIVDQSAAVSPRQAAYIDRKSDDGIPNTGDVQSHGAGIIGASQADCEVRYTARDDVICTMAFLIGH